MSPASQPLEESASPPQKSVIISQKSPIRSTLQRPVEAPKIESLLLKFGKEPSRNIIEILEFCPRYLRCERVHYTDSVDQQFSKNADNFRITRIQVKPFAKTLLLYSLEKDSQPQNLQVILSLLGQEERRLRDLSKTKSLKDYSRSLFESCPDGIIVADDRGYIVNTNRAMVSMSRKPMNSLIGLRVNRLTYREGRSAAFTALRQLKTQSKSHFECRMKVGADRTIPVSINFTNFALNQQSLILAIVRDLSYLEQEMTRCTTYEDSLARSISNASDGFIRYDQFGRISEVNPYVEKITGLLAAHLIGRPVDDLLSNDSLRNFRQAVTQLNKTGYASFGCAVNNCNGGATPALGTLMQLEVNGERYCRLFLQVRPVQKTAS